MSFYNKELSCITNLVCLNAGLDMAMVLALALVRANIDFGLYEVMYRAGCLILVDLEITI